MTEASGVFRSWDTLEAFRASEGAFCLAQRNGELVRKLRGGLIAEHVFADRGADLAQLSAQAHTRDDEGDDEPKCKIYDEKLHDKALDHAPVDVPYDTVFRDI